MTADFSDDLAHAELFCPACGYNLHGIDSGRCPECGLAIDRATLNRSVIPWAHREHIGRFSAFLRTVALATRRPHVLAREVARPVSFGDAQRFRWIVVFLAALPLIVAALVLRGLAGAQFAMAPPGFIPSGPAWPPARMPAWVDVVACVWTGAMIWPVPTIALLLFFGAVSGVSSYFFHPASLPVERQNRAVALSYYACAPLAALIVPYAFLGTAVALAIADTISKAFGFQLFVLLMIVGGVSLAAIVFVFWLRTLQLLSWTTKCHNSRMIAAAVLLPLMWITLGVLTLVVVPGVCGFVKIVIASYSP